MKWLICVCVLLMGCQEERGTGGSGDHPVSPATRGPSSAPSTNTRGPWSPASRSGGPTSPPSSTRGPWSPPTLTGSLSSPATPVKPTTEVNLDGTPVTGSSVVPVTPANPKNIVPVTPANPINIVPVTPANPTNVAANTPANRRRRHREERRTKCN